MIIDGIELASPAVIADYRSRFWAWCTLLEYGMQGGVSRVQ